MTIFFKKLLQQVNFSEIFRGSYSCHLIVFSKCLREYLLLIQLLVFQTKSTGGSNICCFPHCSFFEKNIFLTRYRNSRPEVFLVKGVLKMCSKFTGEHPCRSVISIKLQSIFSEHLFLATHLGGCFLTRCLYVLTFSDFPEVW